MTFVAMPDSYCLLQYVALDNSLIKETSTLNCSLTEFLVTILWLKAIVNTDEEKFLLFLKCAMISVKLLF